MCCCRPKCNGVGGSLHQIQSWHCQSEDLCFRPRRHFACCSRFVSVTHGPNQSNCHHTSVAWRNFEGLQTDKRWRKVARNFIWRWHLDPKLFLPLASCPSWQSLRGWWSCTRAYSTAVVPRVQHIGTNQSHETSTARPPIHVQMDTCGLFNPSDDPASAPWVTVDHQQKKTVQIEEAN